MSKVKNKTLPFISVVIFIITLVFNYGTMFGWFGMTQEEISNQYKSLITPASFAFSIWGLIYLLIIVFLIYQIYLVMKNKYDNEKLDRLNILFIISSVLNIIWNVTWVNDQILISTITILAFTVVLGLANTHILNNIGNSYSFLIPITFGLFFGWLTVATVTNVGAYLNSIGWDSFGLDINLMTIVTYLVVLALATFIISRIKNPLFNLPIAWAFFAIYFTVQESTEASALVGYSIILVIILLLVMSVVVFMRNDKGILPRQVKG